MIDNDRGRQRKQNTYPLFGEVSRLRRVKSKALALPAGCRLLVAKTLRRTEKKVWVIPCSIDMKIIRVFELSYCG
jgi:hypothetical protein